MLSHGNLAWTARALLDHRRRPRRRRARCRTCRCRTSPSRCARSTCRRPTGSDGLLRRVDREGPREPQGGAADGVLRRAAHLGEVPRRHRRRSSAEATGAQEAPASTWARGGVHARSTRTAIAASRCRRAARACSTGSPTSSCSRSSSRRSASAARAMLRHAAPRRSRPTCSSSSRASTSPIHEVYGQSEDTRPDDRSTCRASTKHRHGRPADPRRRGQDRRRRRDPGARPERVPRLLQGARGHAPRRSSTAGCTRAISARSTRRLPDDHRPQEGDHHHRRRQEHRAEEHRGRDQGARRSSARRS